MSLFLKQCSCLANRETPIVAGESAVTGLAGFLIACNDSDLKSKLMINENSKILFFGTEGDTDEEMYEQLVGRIIRTSIKCPLVSNGEKMNIPKRGFEIAEYENRLGKIQKLMFDAKMDAILLTTQVDIEYYTGFKSQFFQSPTRPWYRFNTKHWQTKSNYSNNW